MSSYIAELRKRESSFRLSETHSRLSISMRAATDMKRWIVIGLDSRHFPVQRSDAICAVDVKWHCTDYAFNVGHRVSDGSVAKKMPVLHQCQPSAKTQGSRIGFG